MRHFMWLSLFLLLSNFVSAEKVRVHGSINGYEGKRASIIAYKDHISKLKIILDETKVDASGKFILETDIDEVEYVRIKVDKFSAILYLQPGADYYVSFPVEEYNDVAHRLDDIDVELIFDSLKVLDINNLILDFDFRYDYFVSKNLLILNKPEFKYQLDTFKQKITHVYREIKNAWFRDYVYYSTALLEMMSELEEAEGMGKTYVFDQYLRGKKIDFRHEKYMHLFNQFYKEPFAILSADVQNKIEKAINTKASMKLLSKAFEKNAFMREQDHRELVLIKGLLENYYNINYDQEHMLIILDSLANFANLQENREIARNVHERLTHLSVGSEAPDFKLTNLKGDTVSLSQFKGKIVYLSFWTTWNTTAVSELKLYPGYLKRYGDGIEYISINMNDSKEDFEDFMKAHPDYNWHFLDGNSGEDLKELYQLKSIPAYFLINEDGTFRQSPALRPIPSGTFKSIDETLHNIYWNKKRRGNN